MNKTFPQPPSAPCHHDTSHRADPDSAPTALHSRASEPPARATHCAPAAFDALLRDSQPGEGSSAAALDSRASEPYRRATRFAPGAVEVGVWSRLRWHARPVAWVLGVRAPRVRGRVMCFAGAGRLAAVFAGVVLLLSAAGCAKRARPPATAATVSAEPEAPSEHGMCFVPRHPNLAKQPVRAHDWLSLMTRLELGRGGVFATRDCLGRWINYVPLSNACGTAAYAQTQPRRMAVAEETVVVRDLGDASYLVWVITHRFEDGDGYGPLALARRDTSGLSVAALGVLRLHGERVKLERWSFQQETVVAASGETCQQSQNGQRRCERSTQLLLQHGQQLLAAPVVDPQNRCLEQAQFQLSRTQERPVGGGVVRSFEMSADITHDARYVVVEERLVVRDADTRSQAQPARVVQRVETRRLLQPYAGRLVTRQDSLWKRALDNASRTPSNTHSSSDNARVD